MKAAPSPAPLAVSTTGGVAVVTMQRPSALNALNLDLIAGLTDVLAEFAGDDGVRSVVLTGAGRAFCAGADVNELRDRSPAVLARREAMEAGPNFMDVIRGYPKPTVAAVNGLAIGGGASLAVACDVRIAGPDAAFEFNFARIGLVPEGGSSHSLPRLVGRAAALDLLLSGRRVDARQAARLGLVERVVAGEGVVEAAVEWAAELGAHAPATVAAIKSLLRDAERLPYDEHRVRERAAFFDAVAGRAKDSPD